MARTVSFTSSGVNQSRTTPAHRVFVKERWSADWVEHSEARALSIQWAVDPTIPTARIRRRYGKALLQSQAAPQIISPSDWGRYYCKIELDPTPDGTPNQDMTPATWFGTLRASGRDHGGAAAASSTSAGVPVPHGTEYYTAYGLEDVLSGMIIDLSRVGLVDSLTVRRGITFNENGRPNRAPHDNPTDPADLAYYDLSGGDLYGVDPPALWTTRQIVRYLIHYHGPRRSVVDLDGELKRTFPLLIDEADAAMLPDDDAPTLKCHGVNLLTCLRQLISRQRGLGWYLHCDGESVYLRVFTYVSVPTPLLEEGRIMPANRDPITIEHYEDPSVQVDTTEKQTDLYDGVIVEGARRTNTFTALEGQTLKAGWTDEEEATYSAGASDWASYPAVSERAERQRLDTIARDDPAIRHVFARFDQDPNQFSWCDYSGITDPRNGEIGVVKLFPKEDPYSGELLTDSESPYQLSWRFLDYVPIPRTADPATLIDGSIDLADDDTERKDWMEPVAYLPRPEFEFAMDPTWARLDRLGEQAAIEASAADGDLEKTNQVWSADVRADRDRPALWLRVSGQPRHVLYGALFTGTAVDESVGYWYTKNRMLVTVTVEDDRYCRAEYPSFSERTLDVWSIDHERILRIDAGDDYRLDWIAKGTVVGLDDSEKLYRVSDGYYLRDDREALRMIAAAAWQWYGRPRRTASINCRVVRTDIPLGALVTHLVHYQGDMTEHGSAITSISISLPEQTADAPSVTYETQFGELDALRL